MVAKALLPVSRPNGDRFKIRPPIHAWRNPAKLAIVGQVRRTVPTKETVFIHEYTGHKA